MLMGRGTDATTVYEPSIWEWEAGGGVWRRAGPASPETPWPRGREDHGWVWDGARSRLVLFAGWQLPTLGDSVQAESWGDLWELDPAASGAWTDRTLPAGSVAWPLNRARHAMVFDSGRGRVVLFGGTTATARLQDTWEWSGAFP
jgi:hypothetical protein